jgi:hypothetical protein
MIKGATGTDQSPSMALVLNWLEELKAPAGEVIGASQGFS